VIIFGGSSREIASLYVLDLSSFTWYIPKVTGNFPSIRSDHRTVVIGKYMVVTFGKYKLIDILFVILLNLLIY